jgi:hypothetical protein
VALFYDEVAVDDLLGRHRVSVAKGVLKTGPLLRGESCIPEADDIDLPVRGLAGEGLHEPELAVDEVAVVGLVGAVVVELLVVGEVVVAEVFVVGGSLTIGAGHYNKVGTYTGLREFSFYRTALTREDSCRLPLLIDKSLPVNPPICLCLSPFECHIMLSSSV